LGGFHLDEPARAALTGKNIGNAHFVARFDLDFRRVRALTVVPA